MSSYNKVFEYICEMAVKDPAEIVSQAEQRFVEAVNCAVDSIADSSGRRVLLLSGPSASGKTTTAYKIKKELIRRGRDGYVISLDDFYLDNGKGPKNPDGTNDFETVYALDLPYIAQCANSLLAGQTTELPLFDFAQGRRARTHTVRMGADDVIIFEGLHALNPVISENIVCDNIRRAYISVSSQIRDADENVMMSRREIRFLRRLIRDFNFRGNTAEKTFEMWGPVMRAEDTYMRPYKQYADIIIDSIHPYECCVYRDKARELLAGIPSDSEFAARAAEVAGRVSLFPSLPASIVPPDSLLHEFIG